MNHSEAHAWLARWKEVDERAILELRRLTPEQKFRQLSSLMNSARHFAWPESEAAEDATVRELWNRLRRASP